MKSTIDEHEQYSRRNSLRISGIHEESNEDIVDVTLKFINKELGLASPIVDHDIDRVHRLGAAPSRGQYWLSSQPTVLVNWCTETRPT